ncbi:MAG: DUF5050 domain-containing protein [Oscillospiraceae bacterium]|nr:DUF5050 domain-containing protein [Oscillospiraceae bacterium]
MNSHEFIKKVINEKIPGKEQIREECHREMDIINADSQINAKSTVIDVSQAEQIRVIKAPSFARTFAAVAAAALVLTVGTVFALKVLSPENDIGVSPSTDSATENQAASESATYTEGSQAVTNAVTSAETATAAANSTDITEGIRYIPYFNALADSEYDEENERFITRRDGWVYYVEGNMPEGYSGSVIADVVKIREDGTGKTVLDAGINFASCITVPGDGWVYYWRQEVNNAVINGYYTGEAKNGIFRVREDGTGLTKLTPASSSNNFIILEDRIYYYTATNRAFADGREAHSFIGNLYSVKRDGTDVKTVADYNVPAQLDAVALAQRDWFDETYMSENNESQDGYNIWKVAMSDHFGVLPWNVYEDESFDWDAYFEQFPPIRGVSGFYGVDNDGWIILYDGDPDGLLVRVNPETGEIRNDVYIAISCNNYYDLSEDIQELSEYMYRMSEAIQERKSVYDEMYGG